MFLLCASTLGTSPRFGTAESSLLNSCPIPTFLCKTYLRKNNLPLPQIISRLPAAAPVSPHGSRPVHPALLKTSFLGVGCTGDYPNNIKKQKVTQEMRRKLRSKPASAGEAILKAATALDDLHEDVEIRNVVRQFANEPEPPPRSRRAVRLVPDSPPLTWHDYFD